MGLRIFIHIVFIIVPSIANAAVTLTDNVADYTVENAYYKAVIAKGGSYSSGLVYQLYIKQSGGGWSNNLLYDAYASASYGLGYLEGVGDSSTNRYTGFGSSATVTVTSETADLIVITATRTYEGADFTAVWTFWDGLPYFQGTGEVEVTGDGYLTNQYQFAWMIDFDAEVVWTGTDDDGDINTYSSVKMQMLHGQDLDTYPWINWAFTEENVALGMIFIDLPYAKVFGETGDWPFEYQLDFALGSGAQASPVYTGNTRSVTTIYYVDSEATNTDIASFASDKWEQYRSVQDTVDSDQAAFYSTDPYEQNTGIGSAIVSAPYFLVRQNAQNPHTATVPLRPQYETSIYAPLYCNQDVLHPGSYNFRDQLVYSLNYHDGSTEHEYGTITAASNQNGTTTSLTHTSASDDAEVDYSTTFTTWSDSDKLQITGTATNGDASSTIKDIWAELKVSEMFAEAEIVGPSTNVLDSNSLSGTDSKWNIYTSYTFDYGSMLVYRDNQENVPALEINIPHVIAGKQYTATAHVRRDPSGTATYSYSLNGTDYTQFTVAAGTEATVAVDLGTVTVSSKSFWVNDDDSASGLSAWLGWDRIALTPSFTEIASGYYDLQWDDEIYGNVGIAVKANTPASATITSDGLEFYLFANETAQATTTFSHSLDIEVHPHKGLYDAVGDFTALRSKTDLTYTWPEWGVIARLASFNQGTGSSNFTVETGTVNFNQ